MATEIERKFLVSGDGWRPGAAPGVRYRQGYLSAGESCSVRVRVSDDRAWLNIKSATVGIERSEYEYPIPFPDAQQILDSLCEGAAVEKIRYLVGHQRHTWEVDVFEGDNAGLVIAEIELESVDEAFEHPSWLGPEVSHDLRYYNAYLALHPYRSWPSGPSTEARR